MNIEPNNYFFTRDYFGHPIKKILHRHLWRIIIKYMLL
jgi:hypothetical protein